MASATIREIRLETTTPLTIAPVALWLDAADQTTFTFSSGSNLSQWRDKSGNGNHASQGTAGAQPTYSSALSSVVLNGSSQFFSLNLNFLAGQDHQSFIVLRNYNYVNIYGALNGGASANSLHIGFTNSVSYRMNFWGNDYYPPISAAYNPNGRNIISFDWLSTTSTKTARANGTLEGSTTQYGLIGTMSGGGTIGNVVGQGLLQAEICEIVILLNTHITLLNRQRMEGYLAHKWGLVGNLPATHPFKVVNPSATFPPALLPTSRNQMTHRPDFAPTQIPGCQLWLDAADPTTVSLSGSNVTQWNDKSGNNRHAVVNGTNFATWTSSTNGLLFNNSYYITPYTADPTNETGFVVFNYTSSYPNIIIVGAQSGGREIAIFNFTDNVGVIKALVAWGPTTPITKNTIQMATSVITSGVSVTISANGGSPVSNAALTFNSGGTTVLGREVAANTLPFGGFIHEILFFNSVLQSAQRQQIEGYLAWKWGVQANLPQTHPNRTSNPIILPAVALRSLPQVKASFFNPRSISGCQLWLDASTTFAGLPTGQPIPAWTDRSSNAFSGTAVNSPTVQTNAIHGLNGIQFNGTNQYIDFGNRVNLGTSQLFIFVVCKFNSTADGSIIAKSSLRGNPARWFLIRFAGEGGTTMGADATGSGVTTAFPGTSTSAQLLTGSWDRSTLRLFQNGSQLSSAGLSSSANLSNTDPLYIGAYPNSTGTAPTSGLFFNGVIGEILVFLSSLTPRERQQVEGYLANKWGLMATLPSTHPYKLFPPYP
jgi:hypothetical protein